MNNTGITIVITLTAKDIAKILGVSVATAYRRAKLIKEKNGLNKYGKIRLNLLCEEYKISELEALARMNS